MTRATRRQFLLQGASGAGALLLRSTRSGAAMELSSPKVDNFHPVLSRPPRLPTVDAHVHLFGVGDGGTGCFMSKDQRANLSTWALMRLLGLKDNGRLDEQFVEALASAVTTSTIDQVVLLAQDARYDAQGEPDYQNTPFFVPNNHLFEVVARRPDQFIPCASINPKRRDALEELDHCAARGARLLKIHPPIQDVDPGEERFRPFYRRCREHGILLMVHTGTEHAANIVHNRFSDPRRLAAALEEGCTVIAAHAGFGADFDTEDFFDRLLELIGKHTNLYCDTANLAATHRRGNLLRLLMTPQALDRALHASDFPFPSNPGAFGDRIAPDVFDRLLREHNGIERDYQLKRALGFPPGVFTRAASLLNLPVKV